MREAVRQLQAKVIGGFQQPTRAGREAWSILPEASKGNDPAHTDFRLLASRIVKG